MAARPGLARAAQGGLREEIGIGDGGSSLIASILGDNEFIFGDPGAWITGHVHDRIAAAAPLNVASNEIPTGAAEGCVRSIAFTIPGSTGGLGTEVRVVEVSGKLVFTVNVLDSALGKTDLRALFFHVDEAALPGLRVVNMDPAVTEARIGRNDVIDLGNGANMKGAVPEGFDIGVEFGHAGAGKDAVSGPVTFTLESTHDLTLDILTHMQFGARLLSAGTAHGAHDGSGKDLFVAPAAPDAKNDADSVLEDGVAGLSQPSKTPAPIQFLVLANDTDADGDSLAVTEIHQGPDHGTVTIAPDGKSLSYTPDLDYAGTDSFIYCITDGHGGTDFATANVTVQAVADVPDLQYQIIAGARVNEIIVRVTATQTDADGSEFIDRIELSGIPEGVTASPNGVNPGAEPGQLVQDFLVTLPFDENSDFDLTVSAVSKERSNGDEETAGTTFAVVYEHNSNEFSPTFEKTGQSMWGPGDAAGFDDDRFFGVDRHDTGSSGSTFYASYDVDYRFGLESNLHISSGEVDASIPYSVDVDTFYNRTTDVLHFETSSSVNLDDSAFATQSPLVTYTLDLIAALDASLTFGASIDIPGVPGFTIPGIKEFGITIIPDIEFPGIPGFSFSGSGTIHPPSFDESLNLLGFDGDSLNLSNVLEPLGVESSSEWEVNLGSGFSLAFEIPHVETESEVVGDHLESSGSANFVSLKVDVDELMAKLLGLPSNPFSQEFEFDPVTVTFDLLNYEIAGGMGIGQQFSLEFGDLSGILIFEDGSEYDFVVGNDLDITNARSHDTNGDGSLDISLVLTPDATFSSDLQLALELTHELELLAVKASVDVPVFADPSFTLGPVYSTGGTLADTAITLVSMPSFSFDLGTKTEQLIV